MATAREEVRDAYKVLDQAEIRFQGQPVGATAAYSPHQSKSSHYQECFVRDFTVAALVHLADGRTEVVGNFLKAVNDVREQDQSREGYDQAPGVMPASFWVQTDATGREELQADFGDWAVGRVAPVDSMMWWTILLHAYVQRTDTEGRKWAQREDFQTALTQILSLCLKGSFEVFPTLLVPDGSCMVDRRLGLAGHPIEIQALFAGFLHSAEELLQENDDNRPLLETSRTRHRLLRDYVHSQYWVDPQRLNEIHRFRTEEFGKGAHNALNIQPESLPQWVERWLPDSGGYLVANAGPGRLDVRLFTLGNLLAILFGLTTEQQTSRIMETFEAAWTDLAGAMPMKLCFPAVEGEDWFALTGADPKNKPWRYHNGGHWPVLLWAFVAAALVAQRRDLAEKAFEAARTRLFNDAWPEYYDGRIGRYLGRDAHLRQIWTAGSFLFAHRLLEDPSLLAMFPGQPTPLAV
ncbi:MAG TPA: glycoside hydrolase 100 family protein [Gammaproteobacteria bacterium]|nr:glycoside hydrolase 100 family protein [Gammaproteobacteria bacterium]